MPAAFSRCIVIITVDRTEVGFSPRDTDSNSAACLRVHSHRRAEAQVLPFHVTCAGFLDTRIIVSSGVHLVMAVSEGAVPDDLTFPHSPGLTVWV